MFRAWRFPVGGFSGLEIVWVGLHRCGPALLVFACAPGVVGVAHSRMLRVGGNRGIMRNSTISNGHGLAPMRRPHLTAHGSPTTTHHAHRKIPSFQQQPAPAPHRPRPPMCNTNDNHTHHDTPTTPHTEIGPLPARDRSNSARPTRRRSTHDKLEGENHMPHLGNRRQTAHPRKHDRSRHGLRPISSRSKTDLDASFDRSRRGTGPISAKGGRMGERVRTRPGPSASVEGDERKPRLRLPSSCSPVRPGRCGRPPPPARAWGARRCRGRTARRPAGR